MSSEKKSKTTRRMTSKVKRFTQIEEMSLGEFAESGLWIRVGDTPFGEDIVFASGKSAASRAPEGLVVYLPTELKLLESLKSSEWGNVHRVKRKFQGTVVPDTSSVNVEEDIPSAEVDPSSARAAEELRRMIGG